MSRIDELEARLDELTIAILLPLRASKELDRQSLASLNLLVNDLTIEVGNTQEFSRRLTGKLWFIFTQMLSEADHTCSPEAILDSAWTYQDQLEKLFRPSFSKNPQTPGIPRY